MTDEPGQDQEPDPAASRRPGLGVVFWMMIVFSLMCILAGAVVGRLGPRLFPPYAASPASGPIPPPPHPVIRRDLASVLRR